MKAVITKNRTNPEVFTSFLDADGKWVDIKNKADFKANTLEHDVKDVPSILPFIGNDDENVLVAVDMTIEEFTSKF